MRLVVVMTMLAEKTRRNRLCSRQFLSFKRHMSLNGAMMSIESARMSPIIHSQEKKAAGNRERKGAILMSWAIGTETPSGH